MICLQRQSRGAGKPKLGGSGIAEIRSERETQWCNKGVELRITYPRNDSLTAASEEIVCWEIPAAMAPAKATVPKMRIPGLQPEEAHFP